MRGNVIRDIKTVGTGTSAFGYYLDEGCHDCIVENNVAINVEKPAHNHIVRNSVIRNNVFISDEDMTLSFQASSKIAFDNNILVTPGSIKIIAPNGVSSWNGNKIYSDGRDKNNKPQAYSIDTLMPFVPVPQHKTRPVEVKNIVKPPAIDGKLSPDEWPGDFQRLDRLPSRWPYSGAPVLVKLSWDNRNLYIGVLVTMFDTTNISRGDKWKKDDGIEISLSGFVKGKPATFVLRSFVNGTLQSITDAGVPAENAGRLGKTTKYVAAMLEKPGKGWSAEWTIPFSSIGIKPKNDLKIPFNICAYVNEYDKWHCWEGTPGETWDVGYAGILLLK